MMAPLRNVSEVLIGRKIGGEDLEKGRKNRWKKPWKIHA